MIALKTLYGRGAFPESSGSREAIEELHRSTDSVKAFLDEMTVREEGAYARSVMTSTRLTAATAMRTTARRTGNPSSSATCGTRASSPSERRKGVMYMNLRLKNPDEIFDEDGVLGEDRERIQGSERYQRCSI
jgi:hypothetical protein